MVRQCMPVGTVFGPLLCQWWPSVQDSIKVLCQSAEVGFPNPVIIMAGKIDISTAVGVSEITIRIFNDSPGSELEIASG